MSKKPAETVCKSGSSHFLIRERIGSSVLGKRSMLNILDELDTFESREQAIESSKEAGTCAEGAVGAGDEKNLDIKMRDAVKPPSKKPCHLQVEKRTYRRVSLCSN